jgi:hypothetical protein
MGIYVGNGWFVQSSGNGVTLARLDGWYSREFAWARRPLAEAGLSSRNSQEPTRLEGHPLPRTGSPLRVIRQMNGIRTISLAGGTKKFLFLDCVLLALWRKHMLEWKPRLVLLVIVVASLASTLGWLMEPFNFSW